MEEIWYVLKCPEGNEADYMIRCRELVGSEELNEIACFQYQRMMRYGGKWYLEKRVALPGHIFLSETNTIMLKQKLRGNKRMKEDISLVPCEISYLKDMCQEGYVVGMSKGVILNGMPIVTSGPLKGREQLIRKINRHKRIAKIEIPFDGEKKQVTVGLEIYKKETWEGSQ